MIAIATFDTALADPRFTTAKCGCVYSNLLYLVTKGPVTHPIMIVVIVKMGSISSHQLKI